MAGKSDDIARPNSEHYFVSCALNIQLFDRLESVPATLLDHFYPAQAAGQKA